MLNAIYSQRINEVIKRNPYKLEAQWESGLIDEPRAMKSLEKILELRLRCVALPERCDVEATSQESDRHQINSAQSLRES